MPGIPEVERLRLEDHQEFKASLGFKIKTLSPRGKPLMELDLSMMV